MRETIHKLPFPERRGTLLAWNYNDWTVTALDTGGNADVAADAFEKLATVVRDVDIEGMPAPDVPHLLLVTLKGHRWTLVAPSFAEGIGGYHLSERLGRETGLRVVQVGHGDTASATFLQLNDADGEQLYFESTGLNHTYDDPEIAQAMEDDPFVNETTFRGGEFPADYLDRFKDENDALQTLVRDLDAYLPLVQLAQEAGKLQIAGYAIPEDTIDPANVARMDLVVYGKPADVVPNKAGPKLLDAIRDLDPASLGAALDAGADVERLPGGGGATPLGYALQLAGIKRNDAGIAVVRTLLERGADPNASAPQGYLLRAIESVRYDVDFGIKLVGLLLDHGADVNGLQSNRVTLTTPLHQAAAEHQLVMVKFLHSRGANPNAQNQRSETPRGAMLATFEAMAEYIDEESMGRAEAEPILAYLEAAEAGAAPESFDGELEAAATEQRRRKRKMQQSLGKLGDLFKQLATDATEDDAKAAAERLPAEITLDATDDTGWKDAQRRDTAAGVLIEAGFEKIDFFTATPLPGYRMLAMIDPETHVFAALCEQDGPMGATSTWIDLVRHHVDGSLLTVTNADTPEVAQIKRPRHTRLGDRRWGVVKLLETMAAQPLAANVVKNTASDFVRRFESFYAEEMAARRGELTGLE